MKKFKLYKLIDPTIPEDDIKNHIRYVGWTSKSLELRLIKHINEAKTCASQSHTHKNRWIRKLLNKFQRPIIELICESDSEKDIKNLEISYIKKFKSEGVNLTNKTLGGDGMLGTKWNDNQKLLFNKPIKCYNKQGELLNSFSSITKCCDELNLNVSHVGDVAKGKRKSTGGLIFRFEKDPLNKYNFNSLWGKNTKFNKKVVETDINNNIIKEFSSIKDCCRKENLNNQHLSFILRTKIKNNGERRKCGNRYFAYKEDIV